MMLPAVGEIQWTLQEGLGHLCPLFPSAYSLCKKWMDLSETRYEWEAEIYI